MGPPCESGALVAGGFGAATIGSISVSVHALDKSEIDPKQKTAKIEAQLHPRESMGTTFRLPSVRASSKQLALRFVSLMAAPRSFSFSRPRDRE
jgi:hypothetical protein